MQCNMPASSYERATPTPISRFRALLRYAPQNAKAIDLLDPALARLMPSHPENEKVAHISNYQWWADNNARVQRRFEQWLQS